MLVHGRPCFGVQPKFCVRNPRWALRIDSFLPCISPWALSVCPHFTAAKEGVFRVAMVCSRSVSNARAHIASVPIGTFVAAARNKAASVFSGVTASVRASRSTSSYKTWQPVSTPAWLVSSLPWEAWALIFLTLAIAARCAYLYSVRVGWMSAPPPALGVVVRSDTMGISARVCSRASRMHLASLLTTWHPMRYRWSFSWPSFGGSSELNF